MLSTVIAMPALSESEHGDCFKEAPDTPHRKCCTNGSRPPCSSVSCPPRWNRRAHTTPEMPLGLWLFLVPFYDFITTFTSNLAPSRYLFWTFPK
jgi:hypothetical protein